MVSFEAGVHSGFYLFLYHFGGQQSVHRIVELHLICLLCSILREQPSKNQHLRFHRFLELAGDILDVLNLLASLGLQLEVLQS